VSSPPAPSQARPSDDRGEASEAPPRPKQKRAGHARRARRRKWGLRFAQNGAPTLLRLYAGTWSFKELHPERRALASRHGGGVLLAMWHGRMLLPVPFYRGQDFTILVSGSNDGDLSEALLQGFGYDIVRGSSSKGGAKALRALLEALRRHATVAVTPDGPRGPRFSMNPGLAWMARATGYAILPTGFACDRMWQMGSWDRYNVPKPFARVRVSYGQPIWVPRRGGEAGLEQATRRVKAELVEAERAGFRDLGRAPDF